VTVAAATARRRTEADGAIYAALEEAAAARVLRAAPPAPAGPPVQQMSVDGAMVGLVDGSWREVRTLAIGTVRSGRAPGTVRCTEVSSFSRLAEAATFIELAAGEVHHRGVETAGIVAGVVDGAPWCQTFLATHRPDAVRILDFPHAAQRLSEVAEAVWGAGKQATAWAAVQRRALRDGDPAAVLATIRALPVAASVDPATATQVQVEVLGYLTPRLDQLQYASFRARGLPIGSGVVESANKLVVEARLKGAGMHWARPNVDPMLALRNLLANGRWAEEWPALWCQARAAAHPPRPRRSAPPPLATPAPAPARPPSAPKLVVNGKPTADHPWRRSSPFRAIP